MVATKASKKFEESPGLLRFSFSSIWGRRVKNFRSIASRLLWKKYHQTRKVRNAIFSLAFFRLAPGPNNSYTLTKVFKIFNFFFTKSVHNVHRVIISWFHHYLCSCFDMVIDHWQALQFNGDRRRGCHRDVTLFLSCVTPKRVEIQKN